MQFRHQDTQKSHAALRKLISDTPTITSFTTAEFLNQDFAVILEHNINGQYYLEVAKYSSQSTVILPLFFISNNDQETKITYVDSTTSSSLLSSYKPMSPVITSLYNGEFVIACFQGQFQNVIAKKIDATGTVINIYVENSELCVFTSTKVSEDNSWGWFENIPGSLSLMSFQDNRFVMSFSTEISSVTCDVHLGQIGGPVPSCDNPVKTNDCHRVTTSLIAYNSDGSVLTRPYESSIDDISGRDINILLATTNLLLNHDALMPNTFFLSYYLTSTQHLLAKRYKLDFNLFTSTNDYVPFLNQPINGERAVVKTTLNQNLKIPGLSSLPLAVYESRNSQYNNWQIILDMLFMNPSAPPQPMLISIDNKAGLYHDINPTITALENGNTLITFHRYNVADGSSVGIYIIPMTPMLQFYSHYTDTSNCQDTYGINNYNAADILARDNDIGAVYYCLNGSGYVYPSLPIENNEMASSPVKRLGDINKAPYVVLGIFSVILFMLGIANLLRICYRDKPRGKNSDEAEGLLTTAPVIEFKHYGSGEDKINRFTAFQPQDNSDKQTVSFINFNKV